MDGTFQDVHFVFEESKCFYDLDMALKYGRGQKHKMKWQQNNLHFKNANIKWFYSIVYLCYYQLTFIIFTFFFGVDPNFLGFCKRM